MNISAETGFLLALHQINGVGNQTLHNIYSKRISFQQAWEDPSHLVEKKIIDPVTRDMILASRRFLSPEQCISELKDYECCCLTRWTDGYPPCFNELYDAPAVIYYQGHRELLNQVIIGIVGARAASVYGKKVAAMMAQQLGDAGIVVASGVARGIDSAAHRAALSTEGSTIGVLGCGLDVVYPPENQTLYKMIIEQGLLLSEFPLGTKPSPTNFPRRNRIIAALSRGLVVVEANEKSGALITADQALELGRDVWAVPGPITSPQSRGTNRLIRDGALLALEAGDIINSVRPGSKTGCAAPSQDLILTLDEGRILEVIGEYPVHLDEIAAALEFNRGDLVSSMLKLELKGIITCLAGNHYVRNI